MKGLEVFAPSLTGAGERAHLNSSQITLKTWTDDIVNLIESEDLHNVVLVGHSQGGIVVQSVAETIPGRISRFVFLDAPVLRDGECALDVLPPEIREKFGAPSPDALIQPIALKPNEYLTKSETDWVNARLTPVPTNPSFEKIRVLHSAKIPRKYFFCSQTPSFYPSSFTRRRFDAESVNYELIDAPHDCIWSHAELIAEILADSQKS